MTVVEPCRYHRVVASDITGRVISEYVAEGPLVRRCGGLAFTALERKVYGPYPMVRCYPFGREVVVKAPNVTASPLYTLEESSFASK